MLRIVENFNTWVRALRYPLIASCLIATGCSAISLGYGVLPAYALFSIERYFSFDDAQRTQVRLALDELHVWHRKQELPQYRKLLVESAARSKRPLQMDDMKWFRDQLNIRWAVTADKIALPFAELAVTLRPEQINKMRKKFAEQNIESREKYFQADLSERAEERVKRSRERFETFFGTVSDQQTTVLAEQLKQLPIQDENWYIERLARQKAFSDLLEKIRKEQMPKDQAASALKDYMLKVNNASDPARQPYFDRALRVSDEMTIKLHGSIDAGQRSYLAKKLEGWILDIDGLVR